MEKADQSALMKQFQKVSEALQQADLSDDKLKVLEQLAHEMLSTYKEVESIRADADIESSKICALGQAATAHNLCGEDVIGIINFIKSKGPKAD
ncbi:MAG: hypothetical protein HY052_04225 [Proteobacteria bacterium]|nr:hypothetical protein [Pseudomonadota bacterium]